MTFAHRSSNAPDEYEALSESEKQLFDRYYVLSQTGRHGTPARVIMSNQDRDSLMALFKGWESSARNVSYRV